MDKEKRVYPKEFLEYVQSIINKRAKVVIDHILAYGFITTEDLEKTYGYNHPPRAARDVREAGIPLKTFKINPKTENQLLLINLETLQHCCLIGLQGVFFF